MFRRDEIDLCEDELEDLYEQFPVLEGDSISFESAVLSEQLETEDASDQVLSQRLGLDLIEQLTDFANLSRAASDTPTSVPVSDQGIAQIRHHPFYQQMRRCVGIVKPCAKQAYANEGAYASEWFRVYANITIVPLKIYTGMSESTHGDQIGFEVAQEEYRLAILYLDRILESLTLMLFDVELMEQVHGCRVEVERLRVAVLSQLSGLRRQRGV